MAIDTTACLSFAALASGTVVEETAREEGFKTCADALELVAGAAIADHKHSSHNHWHTDQTDGRMFTSLVSKYYSDGDGHVTITAAPVSSGNCDATYVETFALERNCMSARENIYDDWEFMTELNDTIVLQSESGGVNLYLTPQGSGNICLVSRREVVYFD